MQFYHHFNYNSTQLLSCVTLSVENLHSTTNRKQGTQTMLSHAQSFSESVKEAIKATTEWGVHYFTSRERWYPLPENSLPFSCLKFPKRVPNSNPMSREGKREMREWASINGAVVWQRTGRKETTMARAGTMPENAYFEELSPIKDVTHNSKKSVEENKNSEEEILTYSSDEGNGSSSESENDESLINCPSLIQVATEATFLVGQSSRYGRNVTINKKYFQ